MPNDPAQSQDTPQSKRDPAAVKAAQEIATALEQLRGVLEKIRRADAYVNGYSNQEIVQEAIREIGEEADNPDDPKSIVAQTGYLTRFAELNRLKSQVESALDKARVVTVSMLQTNESEDATESGSGVG